MEIGIKFYLDDDRKKLSSYSQSVKYMTVTLITHYYTLTPWFPWARPSRLSWVVVIVDTFAPHWLTLGRRRRRSSQHYGRVGVYHVAMPHLFITWQCYISLSRGNVSSI